MFLTPLDLRATTPGRWQLLAPLVWFDGLYGRLVFRDWEDTDLASIPRFLRDWPMFAVDGASRRPAVGHDDMYARGVLFDGEAERPVDRKTADNFLRVALIAEGVPTATAWAYYWGVRLGGWKPWRRYRELDRQQHKENVKQF